MTAPLPHFIAKGKFDPYEADTMSAEQERYYLASQWRLMWWKFRRHKLALASGIVLLAMYFSILVSEILAPYNLHSRFTDYLYAPPQAVHWFHEGSFKGPFVYPLQARRNMDVLKWEYAEDTSTPLPIRFFCLGDPYEFWGAIEGRFHIVCAPEGGTLFLLGTDRLGRDIL